MPLTKLILPLALGLTAAVALAISPPATRLQFASGCIATKVTDRFPAEANHRSYIVKAERGQHMLVNLAPNPNRRLEFANTGTVKAPSGLQDGNKGGLIFNHTLSESGDYQIDVSRNTMGTRGEAAGFTLEVILFKYP